MVWYTYTRCTVQCVVIVILNNNNNNICVAIIPDGGRTTTWPPPARLQGDSGSGSGNGGGGSGSDSGCCSSDGKYPYGVFWTVQWRWRRQDNYSERGRRAAIEQYVIVRWRHRVCPSALSAAAASSSAEGSARNSPRACLCAYTFACVCACARPEWMNPRFPWAGPPVRSTGRHWSTGGRVENPRSRGWGPGGPPLR